MHALRELLFDFPQLRPHALADRPALYGEVPVPVFPADVRETQKVERLRLAFSFSFPVQFSGSSELDPARFVWMEFQTKLPQPLSEIFQKSVCFCLELETEDGIIGISHDDHVSLCALFAPDIHPEIENVMQIDIGKRRRNVSVIFGPSRRLGCV